jgi:hypothetical protein
MALFKESFYLNAYFNDTRALNRTTLYAGTMCYSVRSTVFVSVSVTGTRMSKNGLKGMESAGNQRFFTIFRAKFPDDYGVTYSVGTSETTRVAPYFEWLAGIIDGAGCFTMNKKGYPNLEITVKLEDLRCLCYIQDKMSGQIKSRSGGTSFRYRLHTLFHMGEVVHNVNGLIRTSKRLNQFYRICSSSNIPVRAPVKLKETDHWFGGYFDSNGNIDYSMQYKRPQIIISVRAKYLEDIACFKEFFGGKIHYDSGSNGFFVWSIADDVDILKFLAYFEKSTFKSYKSHRFFLLKKFYRLRDLHAYRSNSEYFSAWQYFTRKWHSRGDDIVQLTKVIESES